ncbi:MAG: T9SS type A sorting domain-containing protein, partial [bacterium]
YPGVDGPSDFCQVGGLIFVWQESTLGYNDGRIVVMIEENIPSAPSFSIPCVLPNSQPPAMSPWHPSVAVAPDNPDYVVLTAWSYLAGGNEWAYCWISHDGGYTWTDTIPMGYGACGHVRQGTDGYVFYTYQDYYSYTPTDSIPYPYYMESTDGGYTWSPETPIPGVPVNSGSMFWWPEFDCEVVDNEPWAIHTDIGTPGGGPYILHGTGNPGNWTWEIWDAGQIGACSLTIADTTFYCYPSQYPNIAHDPVSNTILASYKAYYYKEHAGTTYYNGAHIGGIYTTDNGASWTISQPLSDVNTTQIAWGDWSATEVAHRLVNIGGDVWSYAIWVNAIQLILYFERGLVTSFLPLAIDENDVGSILCTYLHINPSISKGKSIIQFCLSRPGNIDINLYDINGRLIKILHEAHFSGGNHFLDLHNYDLPNGIYFVSLETGCMILTRKVVLLR